MSGNPVEQIGGLTTSDDVSKVDFIAWAKIRVPQRMADADEVRNTDLSGQQNVFVAGAIFELDTSDTTTRDDGIFCIVDSAGNHFKHAATGVPAPTIGSLGGVFSSGAVTHQFITGVDTSGNLLRAQPATSDLSGASALTKADDTNVTLTLGGTPASALLTGVSLALGWTGTLAVSRGGTGGGSASGTLLDNISGFASTGILARTGAGAYAFRTVTGTANEISVSNGSGVSGNPTLSLPSALTFTGKTVTGGTFASPAAITGLPDPTNAQDAATKAYVDSLAAGLDVKPSALCATTANITLSGTQTLDGVSAGVGARVLVWKQSTASQNGIYVVASGSWTRATDMDSWAEVPGSFVFVEQGTTYGDCAFVCTADQGGTLGTTAITWSQFAGAGTYTAGSGLTLTGTQFSVGSGQITNAMLAGSIAYSKLALTGAILNADLAGSIAASKLVGTDITSLANLATVGALTSGSINWSGTIATSGAMTLSGVNQGLTLSNSRLQASDGSGNSIYGSPRLALTRGGTYGQFIGIEASGSYPWSIGTVYNAGNKFAIGVSQTLDSSFTNPELVIDNTAGGGASSVIRTPGGLTAGGVVVAGRTASLYGTLQAHINTDQNFAVLGPTDLAAGISIDAVNDAANAFVPLELRSSFLYSNANIGIVASGYLNYGTTSGSSGYGIRDNAGTIEFKGSGGSWQAIASAAASGAGGSNAQVQFNNSGSLAGDGVFVWDGTNHRLGIGTGAPVQQLHSVTADGSVAGLFAGASYAVRAYGDGNGAHIEGVDAATGNTSWQTLILGGSGIALQASGNTYAQLDASSHKLQAKGINSGAFYDVQKGPIINLADYASLNAALAAIASTGGSIYVPAGVWDQGSTAASVTMAAGKSLRIFGEGRGLSVLKWTASPGGVTINMQYTGSLAPGCRVEGLSIWTTVANTGVGLKIAYDKAVPSCLPYPNIDEVFVGFDTTGGSGGGLYWAKGIEIVNGRQGTISRTTVQGNGYTYSNHSYTTTTGVSFPAGTGGTVTFDNISGSTTNYYIGEAVTIYRTSDSSKHISGWISAQTSTTITVTVTTTTGAAGPYNDFDIDMFSGGNNAFGGPGNNGIGIHLHGSTVPFNFHNVSCTDLQIGTMLTGECEGFSSVGLQCIGCNVGMVIDGDYSSASRWYQSGDAHTHGSSSTSVAIPAVGATMSITASTGMDYYAGSASIKVYSSGSPTHYVTGNVASYNQSTGALVVNVTGNNGQGNTHSDWLIVPNHYISVAEISEGSYDCSQYGMWLAWAAFPLIHHNEFQQRNLNVLYLDIWADNNVQSGSIDNNLMMDWVLHGQGGFTDPNGIVFQGKSSNVGVNIHDNSFRSRSTAIWLQDTTDGAAENCGVCPVHHNYSLGGVTNITRIAHTNVAAGNLASQSLNATFPHNY